MQFQNNIFYSIVKQNFPIRNHFVNEYIILFQGTDRNFNNISQIKARPGCSTNKKQEFLILHNRQPLNQLDPQTAREHIFNLKKLFQKAREFYNLTDLIFICRLRYNHDGTNTNAYEQRHHATSIRENYYTQRQKSCTPRILQIL